MSSAFKCDYCKRIVEGKPVNADLLSYSWDITFQRGEDSWRVSSRSLLTYVNDKEADFCRDCYNELMLTYYKMLLARTQSKGSNNG